MSKRSKTSSRNGKGMGTDNYNVGYGKPPESGRFVKGQSGNPKGRPKMKKNMKTIVEEALFEPIPIQQNGKPRTIPAVAAIVMKVRNNALNGDVRSANMAIALLKGLAGSYTDEGGSPSGSAMSPLDVFEFLKDHFDHSADDDGSNNEAGI